MIENQLVGNYYNTYIWAIVSFIYKYLLIKIGSVVKINLAYQNSYTLAKSQSKERTLIILFAMKKFIQENLMMVIFPKFLAFNMGVKELEFYFNNHVIDPQLFQELSLILIHYTNKTLTPTIVSNFILEHSEDLQLVCKGGINISSLASIFSKASKTPAVTNAIQPVIASALKADNYPSKKQSSPTVLFPDDKSFYQFFVLTYLQVIERLAGLMLTQSAKNVPDAKTNNITISVNNDGKDKTLPVEFKKDDIPIQSKVNQNKEEPKATVTNPTTVKPTTVNPTTVNPTTVAKNAPKVKLKK